jgi:hypothetical protein
LWLAAALVDAREVVVEAQAVQLTLVLPHR